MQIVRITLSILLLGALPTYAFAAVGLSGGQYQVVKGDTVIATFSTLEQAAWAAPLLNGDTVSMVDVIPDTGDAVFQVYRDGSVVQEFTVSDYNNSELARDAALDWARNNDGDSVAMPEQSVSGLGK